MKTNHSTKSTKTMRAVEADMTLTECCEPDCKIPLMLEKSEMAQGRKNRCLACTMKFKIRNLVSR